MTTKPVDMYHAMVALENAERRAASFAGLDHVHGLADIIEGAREELRLARESVSALEKLPAPTAPSPWANGPTTNGGYYWHGTWYPL